MSLSEHEQYEIDRANESGRQPVAFVHGLWLLSSSWDRWRTLFEESGYATIAPGWPDDPETVAEARDHPEVFAHKMVQAVTDHYLEAIAALTRKPAVVGHSFGGLIAQKIAGEGASAVTVASTPRRVAGVLPLPASALKSGSPSSATRRTRGGRSPSPSRSSPTAGPTPSTRRRRDSSTTSSTSRRPVSRSSRPPPRT